MSQIGKKETKNNHESTEMKKEQIFNLLGSCLTKTLDRGQQKIFKLIFLLTKRQFHAYLINDELFKIL